MIRYDFPVCIGRTGDSEPVAVIKCNDPGVTLGVQLMTERKINPWRKVKELYTIPEGATAMLRVTRPDRAYTVTGATIDADGVIVCPVHPYSVAAPGRCTAEVSLYDLEGKRLTSASFDFDVDRECAPVDGEDAPVFVDSIQSLIAAANSAAKRAEAAAEKAGNSMDGATFTPYVSEDGVLSWTNDRELENPDPVSIMGPAGPQGNQGPQGDAGPAGADGAAGANGKSMFYYSKDLTGSGAGVITSAVTTGGRAVQYGDLILSTNGRVYRVTTVNDGSLSLSYLFSLKGGDGSDANVTAENIADALGYTPAEAGADITLTDRTTGAKYTVYIDNGKLTMAAESEG